MSYREVSVYKSYWNQTIKLMWRINSVTESVCYSVRNLQNFKSDSFAYNFKKISFPHPKFYLSKWFCENGRYCWNRLWFPPPSLQFLNIYNIFNIMQICAPFNLQSGYGILKFGTTRNSINSFDHYWKSNYN